MKSDKQDLCDMADCYFNGTENINQNYVKAMSLYKEAANEGDAKAQYMVGYLYHMGLGTSKSFVDAFYWFLKASANNHLEAAKFVESYIKNGFHIWR